MTKLNELFEAFVEKEYGGVVTTAAIVEAYEIFLGLTGEFTAKDQRIAYWQAKNISAENFAEQFLTEAAQLNAKNAAAFGVTTEGRSAVVSAARKAAETGDNIEAIRKQVADEVASQPGEGEQPGVPGETFSLTTDADTIRPVTDADLVQETDEEGNPVGEPQLVQPEGVQFSTENNDTVVGAITSRSSTTTFQRDDKIDGGEGFDTLSLTVDGDFRGFTDVGGLTNIQRIELENVGSRERYFDATGVEGVEQYVLNMAKESVELRNLADANIHVSVNDLAKGQLKLGFASAATSTTREDTLTLRLQDVGTEQVGACTTANDYVAPETVTLTGNTGLGQLNNVVVDSQGALNMFALNGKGNDSVTVTGGAKTHLGGFSNQLKTFDASAATGDLTVTGLNGSTRLLSEVKGSQGDSDITVSARALATQASIDGGEGDNKLTVATHTSLVTLQPTMKNIQTVEFTGTDGLQTISGGNIEGLQTVIYSLKNSAGDSRLLLSGLENDQLHLILSAGSDGRATYTGQGLLEVSTAEHNGNSTSPCTGELQATTQALMSADVVASQADEVVFNVSAFTKYQGIMTAGVADEVTLNVDSGLYNEKATVGTPSDEATEFASTAELRANEASVINVNAEGILNGTINASNAEELSFNVAAHNNSVAVVANEAQELTLNVSGDKQFTVTGNLDKVDNLTVNTSGTTAIGTTLKGLSSALLVGTGDFVFGTAVVSPGVTGTAAIFTYNISGLEVAATADEDKTVTIGGVTVYTAPDTAADKDVIGAAIVSGGNITIDGTVFVPTYDVATTTLTLTAQSVGSFAVTDAAMAGTVTGATAVGTPTATTPGVGATSDTMTLTASAKVGEDAADVDIDASDLLGDFAVQVVGYKDNGALDNGFVSIQGSVTGDNTIIVDERNDIEITGGLNDDTITITNAVSFDSNGIADGFATAEVTGGLGQDVFNFTAKASHKLKVTITDFEVGNGVNTDVGDEFNTGMTFAAPTDAAAMKTLLEGSFGYNGVDADDISAVTIEIQATTTDAFEYNGNVYLVADSGNVLVQLQGLSEADYTVV